MSRPYTTPHPRRLWHAQHGWQVFGAGEPDPGDAWHAAEGGATPESEAAALRAEAGLASAAAQTWQRRAEALLHDLAQASGRAEAAEAKLAGAEQRLRDAERARDVAEGLARAASAERDRLTEALRHADTSRPAAPEPRVTAGEISVPLNWRSLPFLTQRALARRLSGLPVNNKDEVFGVIEKHLAAVQA